jgi:uncharacterized protein (TIGR02246 family)
MTEVSMADDIKAARVAVDQWFVVLNAMLNGDPEPFAGLYSHADDVTYMSAEGTYRTGWATAYADWKAQSQKAKGGKLEGSEIQIVVTGDLAAAQHYTQGPVTGADGKTTDTKIRESSVFRKEGGQWKMIAHHADSLPLWQKVVE